MMPGMSGYEVCRKLRENPATALLPVVMVTALDPAQERVKGIEAGADDFLSRPINQSELLARVRSLLRIKQGLAALIGSWCTQPGHAPARCSLGTWPVSDDGDDRTRTSSTSDPVRPAWDCPRRWAAALRGGEVAEGRGRLG
jgi:DNA-binding response OmpR family regulator